MTERRSTLPTTHPACQACVRWISESWPDLMKPVYSSSLDRFVSPVTLCSCTDTSEPTPRSPESTDRSEEHTSELQSRLHLVCRLLLEKTKKHQHKDKLGHRHRTNINLLYRL